MWRDELILMRVYTTRNYLTTKSFVKEVLDYCENKPNLSWIMLLGLLML